MKKKYSLLTIVVLIILTVIITFQVTYLAVNNKYSRKLNELYASTTYTKLASLDTLYRSYFVGDIDEDELADGIMRGYINGVGDQYATYYSAEEFEIFMKNQNGESEGIGIQVSFSEDYGALIVLFVTPGSPAEQAGVLAGDLIIKIGEETVEELGYAAATDKLTGKAGTYAEFSVIRDQSEGHEFKIKRSEINTVTVLSHVYTDANKSTTDIGVVRILGFDAATPAQFTKAIAELKTAGCTKFIFDVRDNPGGELESIVTVLDSLLPEGLILRTFDKAGNESKEESNEKALGLPMVVLCNENTASAAELFTAALKDYAELGKVDATTVGVKTYGKGTMQQVFRLADNSAVSISYRMYNPPYSDNYEGVGIEPDVKVELSADAASVNLFLLDEQMDTQLLTAVSILEQK